MLLDEVKQFFEGVDSEPVSPEVSDMSHEYYNWV